MASFSKLPLISSSTQKVLNWQSKTSNDFPKTTKLLLPLNHHLLLLNKGFLVAQRKICSHLGDLGFDPRAGKMPWSND